ncbi:hypothetical protein HY346_01625 [Candidatus Microgenomates bacterium]|nr:hypothetical protein [Candidatus Microgenomates bacterium]
MATKKRRHKKYRPQPGIATSDRPIIHRFTAEAETKIDQQKLWKRRLLLMAIGSVPLLLVWWLLAWLI